MKSAVATVDALMGTLEGTAAPATKEAFQTMELYRGDCERRLLHLGLPRIEAR